MTDISTIPQEVNIDAYGGDTLTIKVKADPATIAGRVFSGQVRTKKASTKIDVTLVVTITGYGADLMLRSADSHRLTKRGPYEGFWDVQLAMPGGLDPVTTLGYGTLNLANDVTRTAP
jgi:hypothetical protein